MKQAKNTLMCLVFSVCAYSAQAVEPSHWYKLDNLSGAVIDEINDSKNGTISGTVASVSGIDGNAAGFSGNSGYINLGNNTIIQQKNYTIEAWIKPENLDKGIIFSRENPASKNDRWSLAYEKNQLIFNFQASSSFSLTTKTDIPLNQWTHIALTRENGIYKVYVNGTTMIATKDKNENQNNTFNLLIGSTLDASNNVSTRFKGAIDDIKIYNRSLTDDELGLQSSLLSPARVNLMASNGKLTVQFAQTQSKTPEMKDFKAYVKINDQIRVGLFPKTLSLTGANTAELTFDPIPQAAVEQNVQIRLYYNHVPAYTSFTVPATSIAAPSVSNLNIKGNLKTREVLSPEYTYTDANNYPEEGSIYEWSYADSPNGAYKPVNGLGKYCKTMMLLPEHNGKYIKVAVTPQNNRLAKGTKSESQPVGPILVEENNPRVDWFKDAKYGISCHFLPNYLNLSSAIPANEKWQEGESWDDFLATFDVAEFAKSVKDLGAKFLILTVDQHSGYNMAPNAAYEKILGIPRGLKTSHRDLPMEIADELAKYDIKLILYYMGSLQTKASLDYYDGINDHSPDRWGDYLVTSLLDIYPFTDIPSDDSRVKFHQIISEYAERYKEKVAGFWFDGMYSSYHKDMSAPYNINYVVDAARRGNPNCIVSGGGIAGLAQTDYTAGETQNIDDIPLSRWESGKHQAFRWTSLGDRSINVGWGLIGNPQKCYDTQSLCDWARRTISKGGTICMDIRVNRFGELDNFVSSQIMEVKQAVEDDAVAEDICHNIILYPLDAKISGNVQVTKDVNNIYALTNWLDEPISFRIKLSEANTKLNLKMKAIVTSGVAPELQVNISGNGFSETKTVYTQEPDNDLSFGEVQFGNPGIYTVTLTKSKGLADIRQVRFVKSEITGEFPVDDFETTKPWEKISDKNSSTLYFEYDNPSGASECLNTSGKVLKYERTNQNDVAYAGLILRGQNLPMGNASGCYFRYVHILMKKTTRNQVGVKLEGNGSLEKSIAYPNTNDWVDIVVDMGAAGNKSYPNLFIQPDKAKNTATTVYIDNIILSNDPEPRTCAATGINHVANDKCKISVYPNPSKGKAIVSVNGINEKIDIQIHNITGHLTKSFKNISVDTSAEIPVYLENAGLYTVNVIGNGWSQTQKLIITK